MYPNISSIPSPSLYPKKKRASFNPITALPWEEVWWASTIVAADGAQIEWTDTGGTKTLANALAANRPNYRASVAKFNNRPAVQGSVANSTKLVWGRGSDLNAPYTVVTIGAHGVNLTSYSVLVGGLGSGPLLLPVWVDLDTSVFDEAYTDAGSRMAFRYNSNATLWHTGVIAGNTGARFGKNGFPQIGSLTLTKLTGLKIFAYPPSDAFFSDGYIAFIGILPNAAASNPNWLAFLAWVETYYGIATTSRTMILSDSDSRGTGAGFPANPVTANGRAAAAGYISNQFGLQWGGLLDADLPGQAVQTAGASQIGRTMVQQISDAAAYVDIAKNESVGKKYIDIVLNAASNDLAGGATALASYASTVTYVAARKAAGWLVLLGTVPTWTDITAPIEAQRILFNLLVTTNGVSGGVTGANADGICDIAGDSITPQSNNLLNPNFHNENFVLEALPTPHYTHFSAAGNSVVETMYVKPSLALAPFSLT